MRTLSTPTSTAVASVVTNPTYLIQMAFSTTVRLSSGPGLTWNGQTWTAFPVEVTDLRNTQGGGIAGSIRLDNRDNGYGAVVLSEGVREKAIAIWEIHGASPFSTGDAVQLVDGYMDEVTDISDEVTITFSSEGVATRHAPRVSLASFVGEDMPVAGTVFFWNNTNFTLESK